MKSIFTSFFLLILCVISAYGQNVKKLLKNANSFYEERLYKDAVNAFAEVLKVDPANIEANYKTGASYLRTIHKVKATPYLEKAYAANPDYDPQLRFELAQAWHLNHEFEKALKYYKEYKARIDPKDVEGKKLAEKKIFECENGIIYKNNPVKAKITNLGPVLNTKYSEFAPVISADESVLVFTSRRPGSTGDLLDQNQEHYEDVYVSYHRNKAWTPPVNIGRPVNSDEHDASIALSPDGQIVFVYKNDSHGEGDNYYSEFDG